VAVLGLLLAGVVPPALVGALGALLLGLPRRLREAERTTFFLAGLVLAAVAELAAAWFTRPLPYTKLLPAQGNAAVFAGLALVLMVGSAWAWSRLGRRGRNLGLLALAVAGVIVLWLGREAPKDPPTGPNVLLVTLDGARADRFVDPRVDTTATNRVGAEGARFARAYAQVPYTGPSYAALLTGTTPWDDGVWLDGVPLPDDRPSLAEVLYEGGWDTGAFLGSERLARGLGLDRGFRVYDDDLEWLVGGRSLPLLRLFDLWRTGPRHWPEERRAGDVVDRAIVWMRTRPVPWFAWVQLGDARPPFDPPPPYDTRYTPAGGPGDGAALPAGVPAWLVARESSVTSADWMRGRYDGAVASADQQVARLLDFLDESEHTDDTLVVITAPHGLTLGEDGSWFRHDDVSEAVTHVPLVVRWPKHVSPGTVVDDPVELSDVAPSIAAWLGAHLPASWTGRPLVEAVQAGRAPRSLARSVAFVPGHPPGEPHRLAAVRNRRDALVHDDAPGAEDPFSGAPGDREAPDADEQGLLGELMSERARDLLRGWDPKQVTAPDLPPGTSQWLGAQGAKLEP